MERPPVSDEDQNDQASWLRRELTDIVRENADSLVDMLLAGMRERMGGREVYIPAADKVNRDAQIRAMFNGRNLREVMREFGVSQRTVYRACK